MSERRELTARYDIALDELIVQQSIESGELETRQAVELLELVHDGKDSLRRREILARHGDETAELVN